MTPIIFALLSNVSFATASVFYTEFSRKISAEWVNFYKALVAFIGFGVTVYAFGLTGTLPDSAILLLFVSGILGLMIGDIFLLKAFVSLGSGRVLMLFGFQPLILGTAAYVLFEESFPISRIVAVLFLIGCLLSFAMESFKLTGHWNLKGLLFAGIGVVLDASGLLITKSVFSDFPEASPFLINFYRSFAAVMGFIVMSQFSFFKLKLISPLKILGIKSSIFVTAICFLGTFMSLGFYMNAVKLGHLASISAIAGTSPLFATLFETISGRKPVTKFLVTGLVCFILGMLTLVLF